MPGPSSSCKGYSGTPITKDDVNNIINKINERRNFVASGLARLPQAATMNKIYWSEELAATAQRWVDQCDAATRPDREDECRDLDNARVGQAIASVVGPSPGLQLKSMVDVWFMQILEYNGSVSYYNQSRDWKTNYFTQLIWGETDRVGCGRARFYVEQKKSIIERLVCNFAPKGNIHGKPVYAVGYPSTLCQQNKTPDRKFESLCRQNAENNVRKFTTIKPTVSSLLRILNLSLKPETGPNRSNLQQIKFDVNETSEERNQKTRHVLFNNSYASLKNMPPSPLQNPWISPMNYSRNQRLQHYHQERGHSRVYHGHDMHNNFDHDYREPTNRNFPSTDNYPTTRNYPATGNNPINYNYRKLNNEYISQYFASDTTNDLRKYNGHQQCTRKNVPEYCEIHHQVTCTECLHNHADKVYNTKTCLMQTPWAIKLRGSSLCCDLACTPCSTCGTTPASCQCDLHHRCTTPKCNVECGTVPPCRRSADITNRDEIKKSGDHYYDFLPSLEIRSGDSSNIPLKETISLPARDWMHQGTTYDDIFKRLTPQMHDSKQVNEMFENKGNNRQEADYIYDSSYSRERKRRNPADDMTFRPFWQMDEFNRDTSSLLKSIRYTTLSKKVKKTKRTNPTVKTSHTTESITIQLKDGSNGKQNQNKVMTERYLSFDELMHLRKLTSTDVTRDGTTYTGEHESNPDARRDSNANARRNSATAEYTTNTPFMRKKHCTRKLTCTWTMPTVVGPDGSVIVPGGGGDRGSRTPPGYVEGCTRTSTCTRDFMDRNKFATISDEPGSGEVSVEDQDYCEKRALDVRKRDSGIEEEIADNTDYQTSTDMPHTSYSIYTYSYIGEDNDGNSKTMSTPSLDNCACNDENIKRNKRKSTLEYYKNSNDILSYGDLYYLVLQKIISRWKNNHNLYHFGECVCNSAVIFQVSFSLIIFICLYNTLIKQLFI